MTRTLSVNGYTVHVRRTIGASVMALVLTLSACSASDLIHTDYPPDQPNPDAPKSPDGALSLYHGIITQYSKATTGYNIQGAEAVVASGMLADELKSGQFRIGSASENTLNIWTAIDSRHLSETGVSVPVATGYDVLWRDLHGVRTVAMTAIPYIRTYLPAQRDYVGHAYALWGFAEIFLANSFCSGIPLSTVDSRAPGGFTLEPGSTTQEVYEHALTLFDSALANAPDSAEVQNLAKVGKGWALLNLKRYDEARTAVQDVPTDFVYLNSYSAVSLEKGVQNFTWGYGGSSGGSPLKLGPGLVPDREGGNGMPFRSTGFAGTDMRVRVLASGIRDPYFGDSTTYYPANWTVPTPQGQKSIVMASGVEARLIEAEADLAAGGSAWLGILNTLRTDGSFTVSGTDTTWGPGTGGAYFYRGVVQSATVEIPLPGMRPLDDPGTPDARIDLVFAERANWLFLTGRRLSDMRRLVRQYNRSPDAVFPVGFYPAGPFTAYGTDMNFPAPPTERQNNSKYTGCINRDA